MALDHSYSNPQSLIPADVTYLRTAQKSIDLAAYTLTEPTLIAELVAAAQRGVAIRLYLDRSELCSEAHHDDTGIKLPIHPLLIQPQVTAKVKHSLILMHLKAYCVDSTTVRTGSANFSPLGETQQDNEATWTDDAEDLQKFRDKFDAMWNRTDNLTVLQAIDLNRITGVVPTTKHYH